jgi:hypothetical protein
VVKNFKILDVAKKKLKMYVWEDVLADYTSGIMVAYATDVEHARKLLREKCDYIPDVELNIEPREITSAEGIVLWGGA